MFSRGTLALLAVILIAAIAAPAPAADSAAPVEPYQQNDGALVALNVLPPGQGRHLSADEALIDQAGGGKPDMLTNQIDLYESLIKAAPDVTEATLGTFFKDESFGVLPEDVDREYSPREGVTVIRDATYQVPHVYGTTRSDTMFGAGYVSAEDRMFMMDVLRHVGRGNVTELLGATPENLEMDRE
ncbi:MAG: hypothetical protein QOH90_1544, partial [Actinomycetota bacterium]|nr:hypothetical protein [Actinomycetota bacterium]